MPRGEYFCTSSGHTFARKADGKSVVEHEERTAEEPNIHIYSLIR